MIARNARIEGKVQGVFFRAWTVEQATAFGVRGWVRNHRDGSVEVFAVGEEGAVEGFVAKLHEGSPPSKVARVVVSEAKVEPVEGFAQRPSV
jgi:acylphosphatase